MSNSSSSEDPEQIRYLEDAMRKVKEQGFLMKRAIDGDSCIHINRYHTLKLFIILLHLRDSHFIILLSKAIDTARNGVVS